MAEGTCNVPGCEKPVKTRGLCPMHYQRAMKGDEGCLEYRSPSKTTGRRAAEGRPTAPSRRAGVSALKKNVRKVRQDNSEADPVADGIISAVTAFATVMGIRRVQRAEGFLFVGPDDSTVILDAEGELREAHLTIGNVLR